LKHIITAYRKLIQHKKLADQKCKEAAVADTSSSNYLVELIQPD